VALVVCKRMKNAEELWQTTSKILMIQISSEATAEITVALTEAGRSYVRGRERERKTRHFIRKRDNFVGGIRKSNCTDSLLQEREFCWWSLSHSARLSCSSG